MPTEREFPWIAIPPYPQAGQPYAFVNREHQIAQLYKAVVHAGNAVIAGKAGGRIRSVVSGYTGVGKSSVIYQMLEMIRSPLGVADGQLLTMPPGLPDPESREKWLVLRASGKSVPSVDAIAEEIRGNVLSVLEDVRRDAERNVPGVWSAIGLVHRLLPTRDRELFGKVKSALTQLEQTIAFVRIWEGATMTRKQEQSTQIDVTQVTNADVEAQLKAQGIDPSKTVEAQAALKAAASYIRKAVTSMKAGTTVERQLTISADLVVDALNDFFVRTDEAGIPTVLVLDDFDEFASDAGTSHEARARVLRTVLGAFSKLSPTCLVIGLREEYMHEDILRQYPLSIPVPPMDRATAARALKQWGQVQQPALTLGACATLAELGDRMLQRFPLDRPVVIPHRYLQMVAWLCNDAGDFQATDLALIKKYLHSSFGGGTLRVVERVALAMPDADIDRCVEADALDAEPYELTERDRATLAKKGLFRPAMAGDPEDTRVVLDPLIGYLAAAHKRAPLVS